MSKLKKILFIGLMAWAQNACHSSQILTPTTAAEGGQLLQMRVDGDNLYVAYVNEDGDEMCYWFRPTMDNELFTFHRVGYRRASGTMPNAANITETSGITWLNKTTSDNIGPLNMQKGGWVGGNHLDDGKRTAVTRSVKIFADGKEITASRGTTNCSKVTIDVVNAILDPTSAAGAGGLFTTTMLTEAVRYEVARNAIDVTVTHTFASGARNRIYGYYGMQSMFYMEDKVMTPHGKYNDFTPIGQIASFKLGDYPKFDRFIEMNSSTGWCQASHLLRDGIGDHRYVKDTNEVFVTSTYGKNYHMLIRGLNATGGTSYSWHGVYSWFRPRENNANVLVYSSVLNGEGVLYVDVKRACDVTFPLPSHWQKRGKAVKVLQADDGIGIHIEKASRVHVSAARSGTAILE